jgi:hypothetical protein
MIPRSGNRFSGKIMLKMASGLRWQWVDWGQINRDYRRPPNTLSGLIIFPSSLFVV